MPTAPKLIISATELCKQFRNEGDTVKALNNVTFNIESGEFVCILGPSGGGKSTLMNILAGLDVVDSGNVQIDGIEFSSLSWDARAALRRHHIGVVFQDNNLVSEFTALENITLPLRLDGISRAESNCRAEQALATVGISELRNRRPSQMSGGQQQRVGIARALAGGHACILADEPTGALDTAASLQLFELLRRLCDDGLAVVVTTHDLLATRVATRAHVMADGKLSEVCDPDKAADLLLGGAL